MARFLIVKVVIGLLTAGAVVFSIWYYQGARDEFRRAQVELPSHYKHFKKNNTSKIRAQSVFDHGVELLKEKRWEEAVREFNYLIHFYPESEYFNESRRILGDLNLDEYLAIENKKNKILYEVKQGDSYLRIAKLNKTTFDAILHCNEWTKLKSLFPGDKLLLLPLNFRLIVDHKYKTLQLWSADQWVKDYPIERMNIEGFKIASSYKIGNKMGFANNRRYSPQSEGYRNARKSLALKDSVLELGALPIDEKQDVGYGFFLQPEDMEELCMLLRLGNEVEMRF